MAVRVERSGIDSAERRGVEQPEGGLHYDLAATFFLFWFLAGAFLDAWAHNHLGSELETFFTPWHGVFYGGFFATAAFFAGSALRNRRQGFAWSRAVPAGYELSLLGVALFAIGGFGDMVWHTLFGIETDIDAALSPTHLLIVTALVLIMSGPFRAAWRRPDQGQASLRALLPALISLTLVLSTLTLITQFAHPFVIAAGARGRGYGGQVLGVVSVILQSGLLTGLVLLALRRWSLPPGSLTMVFTLNAIPLSFMRDRFLMIAVAVLAGVAADLLLALLRPSFSRPLALRVFAAGMPAAYYLLYFAAIILTTGTSWTVHAWTGAVFYAGATGLLLSCLLLPPHIPER